MSKVKQWYSNLSKVGKTLVWVVTIFVAGSAMSSTQNNNSSTSKPSQNIQSRESISQEPQSFKSAPVMTKKVITETSEIPFENETTNDSTLSEGFRVTKRKGVSGVKTFTYEITLQDGKEINRVLTGEEVTTQPINSLTAVGTKVAKQTAPASSCDPNYSGACVPIASDVDCAGGSGNGPAYVSGTLKVTGNDIYDLDRDGNGIACE